MHVARRIVGFKSGICAEWNSVYVDFVESRNSTDYDVMCKSLWKFYIDIQIARRIFCTAEF